MPAFDKIGSAQEAAVERAFDTATAAKKCKFQIDKKILKSYKFFKLKFEDLKITF